MTREEALTSMINGIPVTHHSTEEGFYYYDKSFLHVDGCIRFKLPDSMVSNRSLMDSRDGYSIYQKPKNKVKWYRIFSFEKGRERPRSSSLFKGKDDFLKTLGCSESDYHWIHEEFICEQEEV